MKKVSIQDLELGMVIGNDVMTHTATVLIPKGVVITETLKDRLMSYQWLYQIDVEDEKYNELLTNCDIDNTSLYEEIRNSTEFKKFQEDFRSTAELFRTNITKTIEKNEPLYVDMLVQKTLEIIGDVHKYTIFDMLDNLKHEDDAIYEHCLDCAILCNTIAKYANYSKEDQEMATACGLLFDIGMITTPSEITKKPSPLTSEEFQVIKQHTIEGFQKLSLTPEISKHILNAALQHHERCDGSGYPYGLKDDEIDRFAKIAMIADVYDAMTNNRSYREALTPFDVIRNFEREGLVKYDISCLLSFLDHVANSFINHKVHLSNGLEGNVIYINRNALSQPIILTKDNELFDLHKNQNAGGGKEIRIESII